MIAVTHIGTYLPETRVSNLDLLDKFEVNADFVRDKIGVIQRSVKAENEKASDLCIKALEHLQAGCSVELESIDCCIVVTQNPDQNIPHVSAMVHGALGLPEHCACFDLSLGCSGYVYGLSVISSFMAVNGLKKGLLFTADSYTDIINPDDKNTALIFGDGATVSLLEAGKSGLVSLGYDFGSRGTGYKHLINEGQLHMNGRMVFNFSASTVPKSVDGLLAKCGIDKAEIDQWYFHQGSKYIVDTITTRLCLEPEKVVFGMQSYGNTVSSSIPLLLSKDLPAMDKGTKIGLSGFGVGLSWASTLLEMQ